MSRFQEALYKLIDNNLSIQECIELTDNEQKYYFDTLQELVDKETPMKPVVIFGTECCAKCKQCLEVNHVQFTRCNNVDCGQKVDWTDENE